MRRHASLHAARGRRSSLRKAQGPTKRVALFGRDKCGKLSGQMRETRDSHGTLARCRAPAHFYSEPLIEPPLQPDIPISGTPFT